MHPLRTAYGVRTAKVHLLAFAWPTGMMIRVTIRSSWAAGLQFTLITN